MEQKTKKKRPYNRRDAQIKELDIQFSELFERIFVDLIEARIEKNKIKKRDFAVSVWPCATSVTAASKWAQTRRKSNKKDEGTRNVRLSEALRMCQYFGQDISTLVAIAQNMAEDEMERRGAAGNDEPLTT